jgi:SPP1 gp7 family putative phage head morphogenesis protein
MRRAITLVEGIEAAEELASALLGFAVQKAIDPLSPSGFLLIGQKVAAELEKAVKGAEAQVIADVIHKLGFDWKKLSPDAATAAMNAVNKAIGDAYAKRVLPKIDDVLQVTGPKVMGATKASVKVNQKVQIKPELTQRDLAAEKAIRNSHVNFIRNSTGERAATLSKKARSMVATGLAQGLGTDKIGEDLHAFFKENIPRPPSYWRTVADAFVGRARATSQIYAYQTAKIQSFEVVAVIDEVTTDQCRYMNGKVFSVSVGLALVESMNALEDPEDVKYAAPWIRKGKDPDGGGQRLFVPHSNGSTTTIAKIERSGVGRADDAGKFSGGKDPDGLGKLGVSLPPYHGRCRTVIVAAAETFEEGAPAMVPGADLEAPPPPQAEQVATPSADEDSPIPSWMTAEQLDVTKTQVAGEGGGVNNASMLTVKDGEQEHRGIWKTQRAELAFEEDEGRALRPGVQAGTFYQREAAVFELDQLIGGETVVPPTITREHGGEKGSLQAYVPGAKSTSSIDWRRDAGGRDPYRPDAALSAKLAKDESVRKQVLLDLIGANDDRHSENTLWKKVGDDLKPVAIDNGLAFPTKPMRFLFAVDSIEFQRAMLKVDATLLEKVELADLASILKKYDGITEEQIQQALARTRALKNDPDLLAKLAAKPSNAHRDPQDVVLAWMQDVEEHANFTNEEIDEIERLAKR